MKRFLIFLLLGPVIGFAMYVVWQIGLGRSTGGVQGLLLGLPFAYIFALLPSIVMWFEDWLLEDKIGMWAKVITSAGSRERADATRAAWPRALATEMSGSNPEADEVKASAGTTVMPGFCAR